MNKKNILILSISIGLLMISIVGLIVYFCISNSKDKQIELFSVKCENISAEVGEWVEIPYIVDDEISSITFEVVDKSIAEIDDNKIIGLKAGTTLVKITVTKGDKVAMCNFYFTAKYNSCFLTLKPIDSCEIMENYIYMENDYCQFSIEFVDESGTLISDPRVTITHDQNLEIEEIAFGYLLTARENGTITFYFDDYDTSFVIHVEKENVL